MLIGAVPPFSPKLFFVPVLFQYIIAKGRENCTTPINNHTTQMIFSVPKAPRPNVFITPLVL